jgi:hypothetical protein
MTIKELHEMLGKIINDGSGDWPVFFSPDRVFKTREHCMSYAIGGGFRPRPPDEANWTSINCVCYSDAGFVLLQHSLIEDDNTNQMASLPTLNPTMFKFTKVRPPKRVLEEELLSRLRDRGRSKTED